MADAGHKTIANIILLVVYSTAHFDIHFIYIATALTPDPVQNLTAAVHVDTRMPYVTLNWDPPANAAGYVTKYVIFIWDKNSGFYREEVVNGFTTTTVIERKSGLRPWSTFTFGVGAYSGDDASQRWMTVSAFVGMCKERKCSCTWVSNCFNYVLSNSICYHFYHRDDAH